MTQVSGERQKAWDSMYQVTHKMISGCNMKKKKAAFFGFRKGRKIKAWIISSWELSHKALLSFFFFMSYHLVSNVYLIDEKLGKYRNWYVGICWCLCMIRRTLYIKRKHTVDGDKKVNAPPKDQYSWSNVALKRGKNQYFINRTNWINSYSKYNNFWLEDIFLALQLFNNINTLSNYHKLEWKDRVATVEARNHPSFHFPTARPRITFLLSSLHCYKINRFPDWENFIEAIW